MNGTKVKGVDDYFAAGGTLDALRVVATTTEPDTEIPDDTFTDSRLAEVIADEVLSGRFCWSKALGWMGWNGTRWESVTEERVGEAVRRFVIGKFTETMSGGKKSAKGWQTMLGLGRQRAVLKALFR